MAENAARVSWAGAGVSLPRRMVTPRGVRLAVRKLLAEERYARAAAAFGAWAAEHDGASLAADAVEALSTASPR
jgi:UDP:flavonoid glycosyltransferase YjiC (YdhE family)